MALFSEGRETVEVWPAVEDVDEWGNSVWRAPTLREVATEPPFIVRRCVVQPMSESADSEQGFMLVSHYRLICREYPAGAKSIVRWRGQLWDCRENPARRQYTAATAHDTVFMRARSEEGFSV